MNKTPRLLSWLVIPLVLSASSCDPFGNSHTQVVEPIPQVGKVEGWAPVYAADDVAGTIASKDPQAIEKGGKIYVRGHMLYQVEVGKGIHVIDIQDGNNPQKVKFIQVTGAQEMAVMDNNLYTNNVNDLVVLNISDINNVQVIDRVSGVFHLVDPTLPPVAGYFECVDASKGVVVGWEPKTLNNPVCRRN
ncbi:MAG: hypothetical protein KDC07_08330 [Chitinophagaceae bacterium]|nr:hypothetical protein [Chitinophagaceae bacterium]MCB9045144.1 hypothetical protein [Chitinophagales bacterium]